MIEGVGTRLHRELESLQDRLMEMAGLAEALLADALQGLSQRDGSVADRVREGDDRVDALETEIDERAIGLLARFQPVASDLRRIFVILKLANDLERVGDHAVNVARAVGRLSRYPLIPRIAELDEMAGRVRGLLDDALRSYVTRDPELARGLGVRDRRVDELRRSMFRILVAHMLEDPRSIEAALELIVITQNLERIADLATNVGEEVVYLVEGRSIRHRSGREASGSRGSLEDGRGGGPVGPESRRDPD